MSATLLRWPLKPRTLPDDLESFVHVATVMALRYCLHGVSQVKKTPEGRIVIDYAENKKNIGFSHKIFSLFQARGSAGGHQVGGDAKFEKLCLGRPGFLFSYPNDPMPSLVLSLYKAFQTYYTRIDEVEWTRYYGSPSGSAITEEIETWPVGDSTLHALDDLGYEVLEGVFKSVLAKADFVGAREKTRDQFKGLPDVYGGEVAKGTSGSTNTLSQLDGQDVTLPGAPRTKKPRAR